MLIEKIYLKKIKSEDFDDIYKIISKKKIYKYIGKGEIWNKEKTKKFINYILKEQRLKSIDNLTKKIVNKENKLIGLISIHKYGTELFHFITIFIDTQYQNKGFGLMSIKKMLKIYKKYNPNIKEIISRIKNDNLKSKIVFEKIGFKPFNTITKKSHIFMKYLL